MEFSRTVITSLATDIFRIPYEYIPSEALIVDVYGRQFAFDIWLQEIRMMSFNLLANYGLILKDDIPVNTLLSFTHSLVNLSTELLDVDLEPNDNRVEDFFELCDNHLVVSSDVMQHYLEEVELNFFDNIRSQLRIRANQDE